jgi:hypothetical protein
MVGVRTPMSLPGLDPGPRLTRRQNDGTIAGQAHTRQWKENDGDVE